MYVIRAVHIGLHTRKKVLDEIHNKVMTESNGSAGNIMTFEKCKDLRI